MSFGHLDNLFVEVLCKSLDNFKKLSYFLIDFYYYYVLKSDVRCLLDFCDVIIFF